MNGVFLPERSGGSDPNPGIFIIMWGVSSGRTILNHLPFSCVPVPSQASLLIIPRGGVQVNKLNMDLE